MVSYENMIGHVMALRNDVRSKNGMNERGKPTTTQLLAINLPLQDLVGEYSVDVWYAWVKAEINPLTLNAWFKYDKDWQMPAPVRKHKRQVESNDMTFFLEMTRTPQGQLETISKGTFGVVTKTAKYVMTENKGGTLTPGVWYKLIKKPYPSKTALSRAMRLWLVSNALGRKIVSTKDLTRAEFMALRQWMYIGDVSRISMPTYQLMKALVQDGKFRQLLRLQPRPVTP